MLFSVWSWSVSFHNKEFFFYSLALCHLPFDWPWLLWIVERATSKFILTAGEVMCHSFSHFEKTKKSMCRFSSEVSLLTQNTLWNLFVLWSASVIQMGSFLLLIPSYQLTQEHPSRVSNYTELAACTTFCHKG